MPKQKYQVEVSIGRRTFCAMNTSEEGVARRTFKETVEVLKLGQNWRTEIRLWMLPNTLLLKEEFFPNGSE